MLLEMKRISYFSYAICWNTSTRMHLTLHEPDKWDHPRIKEQDISLTIW